MVDRADHIVSQVGYSNGSTLLPIVMSEKSFRRDQKLYRDKSAIENETLKRLETLR